MSVMKKFKILLVDDEEEFVKTLSERLQMRDMSSELALNGEEALEIVSGEAPDVMVLDLKMPGMDGMEVLRQVKKAFPKIQVIILTGHGSEKDEEQAKKLGAYAYLKKPVEIDHLIKVMKNAFQKKLETAMMAATFAEAGEFDTAREIMEKEDEKKKRRKKD
jgi:DNA-binding NtrC family response regulator